MSKFNPPSACHVQWQSIVPWLTGKFNHPNTPNEQWWRKQSNPNQNINLEAGECKIMHTESQLTGHILSWGPGKQWLSALAEKPLWSVNLLDLGSVLWGHCPSSSCCQSFLVLVGGRFSLVHSLLKRLVMGRMPFQRVTPLRAHLILYMSGAWGLFWILTRNF